MEKLPFNPDIDLPSNSPVANLTYGSSIILTMPDNHLNVLYGEGFISPSLTIKHFEDTSPPNIDEKYAEFTFSLFKILPFSNHDSFKWQSKILHDYLLKKMPDISVKTGII